MKRSHLPAHSRLLHALALSVFALGGTCAAQDAAAGRAEWEALQRRFNEPRSYNMVVGGVWALTHTAEPEAEAVVKELLTLFTKLGEPFERQQVGGAAGFKEKVAAFLKSEDDAVSGYAATVLAATGDKSYAPRIAALLGRAKPNEEDSPHLVTKRGRAAVALAVLGAREYTGRLVPMLRSANMYDRSGAATALGLLGAREHARDVAALLTNERLRFQVGESAIGALFEMGVAAEYAGVFASLLRDELVDSETVEAAAYALAALKARRYAKDVALLLERKYQRGDAAKALALLGAAEYAPRIARLLRDEGSLDQAAALLALGIFGSKQYVPEAARILREQNKRKGGFVANYAAEALVLLGAEEYAAEVVPLVEAAYREKLYLGANDFHPLVEDELAPVRRRFEETFLRMLARRAK